MSEQAQMKQWAPGIVRKNTQKKQTNGKTTRNKNFFDKELQLISTSHF